MIDRGWVIGISVAVILVGAFGAPVFGAAAVGAIVTTLVFF